MYWSDALNVPEFLAWREQGERGTLQRRTIDLCIQQTERAYDLMPLPVIATRLVGLNFTSLCYFGENEPEYQRRVKKIVQYTRAMKLFLNETLPEPESSKTRTISA